MNYHHAQTDRGYNDGPALAKYSPLENIHKAASVLSELESRVRALAENLVGTWPTNTLSDPPEKAVTGQPPLIDALGSVGSRMCGSVSRINEALSAIDAKLPG